MDALIAQVAQLLEDCEHVDEVNKQLDKMYVVCAKIRLFFARCAIQPLAKMGLPVQEDGLPLQSCQQG